MLMPRFRKRPVEIEAFRYGDDPRPNWFQDMVAAGTIIAYPSHCFIKTLEGDMRGGTGDWIIQGVQREVYPCKSDIFAATYEPVPDGRLD